MTAVCEACGKTYWTWQMMSRTRCAGCFRRLQNENAMDT